MSEYRPPSFLEIRKENIIEASTKVTMVGTRSGRTSYASTQAPKNPKEAKAKVVKNKKVAPTNAPKGSRGKRSTAASRASASSNPEAAVTEWLEGVQYKESNGTPPAAPKPTIAIPAPEPVPAGPSVERVFNNLWESTTASLAFVYQFGLDTDQDTETIALNLIDHIIKPEIWNPDLSWNVLSATCFFFASQITEKRNSADRIAAACRVDPQVVAAMAGAQAFYDPGVKQRLAQALAVSAHDVKRGYKILYDQKDSLMEFVGGYADKLAELANVHGQLRGAGFGGLAQTKDNPLKVQPQPPRSAPQPTSVDTNNEEVLFDDDILGTGNDGAEDASAAALKPTAVDPPALVKAAEEKASEADLDLFDLDEFDTYVLENE